MACHEIAALRLGLMGVLGHDHLLGDRLVSRLVDNILS
jgi:hypothetical protein